MRMPWNYLSDLVSRKTSKEAVEKLPAPTVVSLKIRVADSAAASAEAEVVTSPTNVEPQSEADSAPRLGTGPMTDEGETLLYVQDNLHPEPDTTETNSSEIDDVRAADADEDLELDLFVQNAVDPQTDAMPEPATMQELSVLSSKNAEALSLKEKRKAKPPIIDLPSTRVRAVDGDMAELDAEIAELRRTLSSKLSVQNEQLRQLLQRFPE